MVHEHERAKEQWKCEQIFDWNDSFELNFVLIIEEMMMAEMKSIDKDIENCIDEVKLEIEEEENIHSK